MNIERVIKTYFIFVMFVVAVSIVGYNTPTKAYMANVLGYNFSVGEKFSEAKNEEKQTADFLTFAVTNNPKKTFVFAGAQNSELMKLVFRSAKNDVILRGISFKIALIDPKYIKSAALVYRGKLVAEGVVQDGKLNFANMNHKFDNTTEDIFSLSINLTDDIPVGQRVRMDIENPDDIVITNGENEFKLRASYPMKGRYLSVAQKRTWGVKKAVKKPATSANKK